MQIAASMSAVLSCRQPVYEVVAAYLPDPDIHRVNKVRLPDDLERVQVARISMARQ